MALKLEIGMYDEAARRGKSFGEWLETYRVEKGEKPSEYFGLTNYERELKRLAFLRKGEEPPLTAFEMELEANDIKAFGLFTDRVEKFFQSADTSVLFPEFIANRVYAGALQSSIVPEFVAVTSVITGLDFRKLYLEDTQASRELKRTARGGEFPETQIKAGKQNIALAKYGRAILFDYEVVYSTPINIYSVALQRIGKQIGLDESDAMIYALLNGDGNDNGLETEQTKQTTTSGAIVKKDIIAFAAALPQPYSLNKFVGRKTKMVDFWEALSNMQNPVAQWGQTGMTLPRGFEWDRSAAPSDKLIGVDASQAIGYVTNDTMNLTETERIIAKQQVRTVISKRSAFDIIDPKAIGCLLVDHA